MNYQELLERLRRGHYYHAQIEEAADVIESLLAENKRLNAECDEWEANSKQWEQEYYKKDTELAKQRDELLKALENTHNALKHFWPEGHVDAIAAIARAKGEQ